MENKELIVECEITGENLICKIFNDTDYDNTINGIIIVEIETSTTIYSAPLNNEVIKSKIDIKRLDNMSKSIITGYLNSFGLANTSMFKLLVVTVDNDKFESNAVRFNN